MSAPFWAAVFAVRICCEKPRPQASTIMNFVGPHAKPVGVRLSAPRYCNQSAAVATCASLRRGALGSGQTSAAPSGNNNDCLVVSRAGEPQVQRHYPDLTPDPTLRLLSGVKLT